MQGSFIRASGFQLVEISSEHQSKCTLGVDFCGAILIVNSQTARFGRAVHVSDRKQPVVGIVPRQNLVTAAILLAQPPDEST